MSINIINSQWDTFACIFKVSFEKKSFHMKEKTIKISDIKVNVLLDGMSRGSYINQNSAEKCIFEKLPLTKGLILSKVPAFLLLGCRNSLIKQ